MRRPTGGGLVASPVLTTLRVIAPGEQLTFDYNDSEDVDVSNQARAHPSQSLMVSEGSNAGEGNNAMSGKPLEGMSGKHRCLCGSVRCRQWLPDIFSS
jgi:hypothetical protein